MSFHHLDQYSAIESVVTRRPPVVRLLATVLLALGAAFLPLGAWPQLAALGFLVLVLATAARIPPRAFLVRLTPPLVFVALASAGLLFLGAGEALVQLGPLTLRRDGLTAFASAAGRATVAISAGVILVSTTSFVELVEALRTLRVPAAVTTPLAMAYRFLYLLDDEVERMRRAAASRGSGGRGASSRRRLLMGITAASLHRTFDRSERVYGAMLARGYSGTIHPLRRAGSGGGAAATGALAACVLIIVGSAYV